MNFWHLLRRLAGLSRGILKPETSDLMNGSLILRCTECGSLVWKTWPDMGDYKSIPPEKHVRRSCDCENSKLDYFAVKYPEGQE